MSFGRFPLAFQVCLGWKVLLEHDHGLGSLLQVELILPVAFGILIFIV
jgi:hypothetical protein